MKFTNMSRIGKKPILIPSGVTVSFDNEFVKVTGPLGFLEAKLRPEIGHSIEDNILTFVVAKETKESSAFFGLVRSLVNKC